MSEELKGIETKIHSVQTALERAVKEWLAQFLKDSVHTEEVRNALYVDMLELRQIRWFAMNNDQSIESLWNRYIQNTGYDHDHPVQEALFDFYTNGTNIMLIRVPLWSGVRDQYLDSLSRALNWMNYSKYVSKKVREYSMPTDSLATLLKECPWFLFLVLLSMIPLEDVKYLLSPETK